MKLFKTIESVEALIGFILVFLCACCIAYETIAGRALLFHPESHHLAMMCWIEGFMCNAAAIVLVIFYIKVKPMLDTLR